MTRIFAETQEQADALDRLNSSYRAASIVQEGRSACLVTLVDNVTGNVWHEAFGATHADALATALATATPSSKPKTTAELAAESIALADENAKLRELVDQLKARTQEPAPMQDEVAAATSPSRRRAAS